MSEEASLESIAQQLPTREEWRRSLNEAAAAIDAVSADIARAVRDLTEYWRTIAPVMARIHHRSVVIAHRRRQHARRAEAKASRRARSGWRQQQGEGA